MVPLLSAEETRTARLRAWVEEQRNTLNTWPPPQGACARLLLERKNDTEREHGGSGAGGG